MNDSLFDFEPATPPTTVGRYDIQTRLKALTSGQRARIAAAAERLRLPTDLQSVTTADVEHYVRLIDTETGPPEDETEV